MEREQQYKWRKHRKNKRILTIWLVCVALVSMAGAFLYQGMYDSNPTKVAERYMKEQQKVWDYKVSEGTRILKNDGGIVQSFTFTYAPAGSKEEITEIYDLTRQDKKRYGVFERWTLTKKIEEVSNFKVVVPAGTKVSLDGKTLDENLIVKDEKLSGGAVSYIVPTLEKREYQLRVTGLPFDSYDTKVNTEQGSIDVRTSLKISENAKTQMEELGKKVLKDFYNAAYKKLTVKTLDETLKKVEKKEILLEGLTENLNSDPDLQLESLVFSKFQSTYGELTYPEAGKETPASIEVKMKYQCEYKGTRTLYDDYGNSTGETREEVKSLNQEAKFFVYYEKGKCQVQSVEIPNVFSSDVALEQ